jgi:ABC-type phosphate transport system auxiliary subunit
MLTQDILELLNAPEPAEMTSFLDRLDATLTAGYAHALQLEAERWRLERRIGEIAASLEDDRQGPEVDELARLGRRLALANEDIASLRGLLTDLRGRRTSIRQAA